VGYGRGTDFFTASTSGPVFGELVAAACSSLLRDLEPGECTFVEIGAENTGGVLAGVNHPFARSRTIAVGEPLELTGHCVVFSNELFDAQPFRRFRYSTGAWREIGVAIDGGGLVEIELPGANSARIPVDLPEASAEGYTIDAPLAAVALLGNIAAQDWDGLFVALDYGKSWQELIEITPAGTARAYHRHTQTNDLLAQPGEQDLTCHICWDWLVEELRRQGFDEPQLQTQEAFFIRNAEKYIAPAIAADAMRLTPRKRALLQLLHGSQMGQKFQALHAWR
jgi:SAM-dependent MidA family methyltransferase